MLEIYGGNEFKLRTEADFARKDDDQMQHLDFQKELSKMSKHYKGGYVEVPRPKSFNPDCE